jgi:MtN3 and saliva related transmembrane protein
MIIGLIGGTGTTVSFLPQVYKVFKHKKTENLSPIMFCIHTTGVLSWIVYGILIGNYIIIMFNAVTFLLCLAILGFMINERINVEPDVDTLDLQL